MSTAQNRVNSRITKSWAMYHRALELIPGGTQLISRRPTRFAFGVSPIFATRGKGARIWDVDGNEYIDWVSGIGAILLGYADPVVDEAVKSQIDQGTNFSITHELELELAEELVATIPCAEMVRYTRSGGEACAVAVRIARGTTGRDKILFCGYHGWHDWYMASNLSAEPGLDEHLFSGIEPIGVPRSLKETAIPFPYNDLNTLGELLDRNRGEVAAIIMEPFRSELPPDGYLAGVQRLAREHDVILIFDEVTTGFRLATDGIQSVVGVVPDMSVFAKSISNGYAMGVVTGKQEVMSPAAQMFISSTYWGETVGLTAALTTLREVKRRNVPAIVQHIGEQLKSGLSEIASEIGLPAVCKGASIHPYLEFQIDDAETKTKLNTLYIQEMAKRGCHGYTSFYLNASQGDAEITQTLEAARETFTILADGLNENRIDDLLECVPKQEYFQRLVH